ncbi:MAG: pyruvate kinase [Chloroflexota bacterium]
MIRTKVVCTIGPSSQNPAVLRSLMIAGMDVARLNLSHGDHDFHDENIRNLRQVSKELNHPLAIMADLQGPKLRVGTLPAGGVQLDQGEDVILTPDAERHRGNNDLKVIPIQSTELPTMLSGGEQILIDDGLLELKVIETVEDAIRCQVVTEGTLLSKKGLNLPDAPLQIPCLTDKDLSDLAFALEADVDWIALSFVRSSQDVVELRGRMSALHEGSAGRSMPLPLVIAKIEKPEAVADIENIVKETDAIMVARGDLGIETATERVPMIQKRIIRLCNNKGIPVITATQMLDSMIRHPRPTRAEASDVANAILDGTDAIMLSGETAAGLYPVKTVKTIVRIANEVEKVSAERWRPRHDPSPASLSVTDAVSHATCLTAIDLDAKAIISATTSGGTAKAVARYEPPCPIVAVTPHVRVQRQLLLVRGVWPVIGEKLDRTDEILSAALEVAKSSGFVESGDRVVMTAGLSPNLPGTTNLMQVESVP